MNSHPPDPARTPPQHNLRQPVQQPVHPPARAGETPARPALPQVVDRSAERALSALAHGAILFGVLGISFLVSLAVTGVIWLYSRRSPDTRFHSEQAGCYQCSVLLINVSLVVIMAVTGGFSVFQLVQGREDFGSAQGVGLGLILFVLWFFGSILYGLYGAIMVLRGKRFKYPIIGDRFERRVF